MCRILSAIIGCLLAVGISLAQDSTNSLLITPKNEIFLKVSPLSLFETDGGLSFSGEYLATKQRIGYQLEVQPLFFSVYNDGDNTRGFDKPVHALQIGTTHGIKLRQEVRYYTNGLKLSQRPPRPNSRRFGSDTETRRRLQIRTYIAATFLYKQVWRQNINEFEFSNSGAQPVAKQAEYTDVKRVIGYECKVGIVWPRWNERWLIDAYFGLGIRFKKFSYRNLPAGASEPRRGIEFLGPADPGTHTERYPSFPIGIRITYRM